MPIDVNSNAGESSNPKSLTVFNDALFFSATSETSIGAELFKITIDPSTGAETLTRLTVDDASGNALPIFGSEGFFEFDGELYFRGQTSAHGDDLFKLDATATMVTAIDVNPLPAGAPDTCPWSSIPQEWIEPSAARARLF